MPCSFLAALIAALAAQSPDAPIGLEVRVDVPEVGLAAPRELREEYFALELENASEGAGAQVGLAVLRRSAGDAGLLLEWEVHFPREHTRVLHVERMSELGTKLVWRELGAGRGRTLSCERSPFGAMRVLEWTMACEREEIAEGGDVVLPLYLLELARSGDVEPGRYRVFDPPSRAVVEVALTASFAARAVAASSPQAQDALCIERTVELRRADGSLFAAALFVGSELERLRWQGGGLVARRLSKDDYDKVFIDEIAVGEDG
jgi:hypothetical protein